MKIAAEHSIPEHYEQVRLRAPLRLGMWLAALVLVVGGMAWAATSDGRLAETLAPIVAVVGGAIGFCAWQLSRCEITVGTKRTEVRAGRLIHITVPTGAVESASVSPASGWRSLYGSSEVVLVVNVGPSPVAVPSSEPDLLVEALRCEPKTEP
ncbi:MAG: hypothetical protein GY716_21795 [bacterium]|nr:hypothetical protein [bacterium]